EWAGDCHCDYAFHTMVQGKLDWSIPDQLAEAVAAGHPTVKMFTTDITPSRKGRMVPFGSVMEVLTVLAKTGGLAAIHAEDNDLVMHMYEKLTREGRTSFHNMAEVHTTLSEDLAFNRVIRLAANIEGSALYMLHTSAATGVRAIAADHAALWAGTNHGAIQTVATDEICCPLKFKLQGDKIDDTTGGNAGVEPRVSLIYTETVEKRGYDLTQFVNLIS